MIVSEYLIINRYEKKMKKSFIQDLSFKHMSSLLRSPKPGLRVPNPALISIKKNIFKKSHLSSHNTT